MQEGEGIHRAILVFGIWPGYDPASLSAAADVALQQHAIGVAGLPLSIVDHLASRANAPLNTQRVAASRSTSAGIADWA